MARAPVRILSLLGATILVCLSAVPVSAAPPALVKDIRDPGSSRPQGLLNVDGIVYFSAGDGVTGRELWRTDGTRSGTYRVKDINPRRGSFPNQLVTMGGELYFTATEETAGYELWKSDGTSAGTKLVRDILPGMGSSYPNDLTVLLGRLYFFADDGLHGRQLWQSDGTRAGTRRVTAVPVPPIQGNEPQWSNLTALGTHFYFTRWDAAEGTYLWRSDGTREGTARLWVSQCCGIYEPLTVGDHIFFATGGELWRYDPSTGTRLVRQIVNRANEGACSCPRHLTRLGANVMFIADVADGPALWWSDGTTLGTRKVAQVGGGYLGGPPDLTSVGRWLYFTASDPAHGWELWRSDGTRAGTRLVKDTVPGAEPRDLPEISALTNVQQTLLFAGNDHRLWRSDGTAAGTTMVAALHPYPTPFTVADDAFFSADDGVHGWELFRYGP
jgi:ELWxxDGT repeat protein